MPNPALKQMAADWRAISPARDAREALIHSLLHDADPSARALGYRLAGVAPATAMLLAAASLPARGAQEQAR